MKNNTYKLKLFLSIAFFIFSAIFSQGCLSDKNPSTSSDNGILTGNLPIAKNSTLYAISENEKIPINVDAQGNFTAQLLPGKYNLLMETSDGKLTLIKENVTIENNLTFEVVNVDLVPIPQVVSVSVPLIYKDSAVIEWETNIKSDGRVDYGTNELYGYSAYTDSDLKLKHRVQLFNLQPGTTYHFRIIASRYSLESAQSISRDFQFTTES